MQKWEIITKIATGDTFVGQTALELKERNESVCIFRIDTNLCILSIELTHIDSNLYFLKAAFPIDIAFLLVAIPWVLFSKKVKKWGKTRGKLQELAARDTSILSTGTKWRFPIFSYRIIYFTFVYKPYKRKDCFRASYRSDIIEVTSSKNKMKLVQFPPTQPALRQHALGLKKNQIYIDFDNVKCFSSSSDSLGNNISIHNNLIWKFTIFFSELWLFYVNSFKVGDWKFKMLVNKVK